jgi:hypothetical protein
MGRLELDKKIKISTETAYRFVLQDKAVGGALYKYLHHQHKKYRKQLNSLPLSKVKVLTQCLSGVSSLLIASFAFCAVLLTMGSARYSLLLGVRFHHVIPYFQKPHSETYQAF